MKKMTVAVAVAAVLFTACGEGTRPEVFPRVSGWFCSNPGASHCTRENVMLYCANANPQSIAYWEEISPAPRCTQAEVDLEAAEDAQAKASK